MYTYFRERTLSTFNSLFILLACADRTFLLTIPDLSTISQALLIYSLNTRSTNLSSMEYQSKWPSCSYNVKTCYMPFTLRYGVHQRDDVDVKYRLHLATQHTSMSQQGDNCNILSCSLWRIRDNQSYWVKPKTEGSQFVLYPSFFFLCFFVLPMFFTITILRNLYSFRTTAWLTHSYNFIVGRALLVI